jgi:hypothetical protein
VATPLEIEQAKNTRIKQGKHVNIRFPAMELKKQFSGYFLDPLQYLSEKVRANSRKSVRSRL